MLPKTTLAMVQTEPRKLEPRDLPIPEIGEDSALLRIEACGICGSDYEQFDGALPVPYPLIPGHEPLGVSTWADIVFRWLTIRGEHNYDIRHLRKAVQFLK